MKQKAALGKKKETKYKVFLRICLCLRKAKKILSRKRTTGPIRDCCVVVKASPEKILLREHQQKGDFRGPEKAERSKRKGDLFKDMRRWDGKERKILDDA